MEYGACGLHESQTQQQNSKSALEKEAEGLEPTVLLSRGARFLVISNLWTLAGLANGSAGKNVDILYDAGTNPPTDMPLAVMVKFDYYIGSTVDECVSVVSRTDAGNTGAQVLRGLCCCYLWPGQSPYTTVKA